MRNISFASVPFILEYEEPLTNSISIQQISRSAQCNNISFEQISQSVPFCLEYKEHLTNSLLSCYVPFRLDVENVPIDHYNTLKTPSSPKFYRLHISPIQTREFTILEYIY